MASPLTLSEIRSMLPAGLSAELLTPPEQRTLLRFHPDGQTAVRILHGACSCDLVRYRLPVTRTDEAHLRSRYQKMGLSRDMIIRALDDHRRASERRQRPQGHWPAAISSFVVEHARNAGPTLYYLEFSGKGALTIPSSPSPDEISTSVVREQPGVWLPEGRPTMVVRSGRA